MRAERFGSYSIVDTFAGMSRLSRLKSITRYIRLWPPPRHHEVSSPRLLRPPDRRSGSTSGLYGSVLAIALDPRLAVDTMPFHPHLPPFLFIPARRELVDHDHLARLNFFGERR